MIPLYKQYISKIDKKIIETYYNICNSLNTNPIIFCDNLIDYIEHIKNISVFHTLYLNKIYYNYHRIITFSEKDYDIVLSLGLKKDNILLLTNFTTNHDKYKFLSTQQSFLDLISELKGIL
jgi:hypothetical protein